MTGEVFFNKLKDCEENKIVLQNEITSLSKSTYYQWRQLIGLRSVEKEKVIDRFRKKHWYEKSERLQMMVISHKVTSVDFGTHNRDDQMKLHIEAEQQKRANHFFEGLIECTRMAVEDDRSFGRLKSLPMVFEDVFEPIRSNDPRPLASSKQRERESLSADTPRSDKSAVKKKFVILVHGLGANHMRILIFKHFFKKVLDDKSYVFHPSKVNENKTMDDINSLAENLIVDIEDLLHEDHKNRAIESISFVGHSMGTRRSPGGLIIRAALPLLGKYKKLFKTFITFATPHLGVAVADSALMDIGRLPSTRLRLLLFLQGLRESQAAGHERQREPERVLHLRAEHQRRLRLVRRSHLGQQSHGRLLALRLFANPALQSERI